MTVHPPTARIADSMKLYNQAMGLAFAQRQQDRDRPPLRRMTDVAWQALWDVERADAECVGCAAHQDPACLCDVDISKTADSSWDRGPMALLEVETLDELIPAAASMLLQLQLEIAFKVASETPLIKDSPRGVLGLRACAARRRDLPRMIEVALTCPNVKAGWRQLIAEGVVIDRDDFGELCKALGNGPKPYLAVIYRDVIGELASQGKTVREIADTLQAKGHNMSYNNVYKVLQRNGFPIHTTLKRRTAA